MLFYELMTRDLDRMLGATTEIGSNNAKAAAEAMAPLVIAQELHRIADALVKLTELQNGPELPLWIRSAD